MFLCLEHHNQYDSRTSQSKGLQESEVRGWRDELYMEMAYRFRTIQNRSVQLTVVDVVVELSSNRREPRYFQIRFRLKNTGTDPVRTPTVAIRLPDGVGPKAPQYMEMGPLGHKFEFPDVNPCSFDECREDFFEPNGRVAIATPLPPLNPVLIPGHSATFDGIVLPVPEFSLGTELRLPYRVDAEDMDPVTGELQVKVPDDAEQLIFER